MVDARTRLGTYGDTANVRTDPQRDTREGGARLLFQDQPSCSLHFHDGSAQLPTGDGSREARRGLWNRCARARR